MKQSKKTREWTQLRALCHSGLDAMTIAADAFSHLRQLLPNAASALFLTNEQGIPQRFFHENSPESVRTLFQNEFHLFCGPQELNVVKIVGAPQGPGFGRLLQPDSAYYRSNTYQMLVRASGHHHALEIRLAHRRHSASPTTATPLPGAGAIILFREEGIAFDKADLADLIRLGRLFEHNLAVDPIACQPWEHGEAAEALVVAQTNGNIMWMSPEAERLIAQIPLMRHGWQRGLKLPLSLQNLILQLQDSTGSDTPRMALEIAGGWLHAHAQWLNPPHAGEIESDTLVGLMLKRIVPRQLSYWHALKKAPLTPRQFDVAFALVTGGSLQAVRSQLEISDAVLKDCVRAIYQHYGVNSQNSLVAELLRQAN